MSVQQIWNLSRLLELFSCRKFANLSWNFATETSKQGSKATRHRLCCEKLDTSHFSVVLLLKEQLIISAPPPPKKKMLKMLVRLMQNRLIFSNISREYSHEIRHILLIVSQWSLSRKIPWNRSIFPRICPWKFLEIWLFCPWPIRSPGLLPLCQHDNLLAFPYSCYFCQSPPPPPSSPSWWSNAHSHWLWMSYSNLILILVASQSWALRGPAIHLSLVNLEHCICRLSL